MKVALAIKWFAASWTTIGDYIFSKRGDFSHRRRIHIGPRTHPAPSPVDTGNYFSEDKTAA
jgi:hypothetical protein